ncbi:MAG TPA: hypothetical protein DEQ38_12420 [Elusimicrobia bacterium]|nr:MAG: hypothetical protein A2089_06485 [Elusimicrobia bacterium GWD2_63_28]HCC48904.1 hypothetical protein [Elusimicrobiota bacterium]
MEDKQKMKFSAAIAAAVFSIAPAFAADWAPEINAVTLAAVELTAPALTEKAVPQVLLEKAVPQVLLEKAVPKDGQNYSGAEELLIKEFGVTGIGLDIPESEVMRQTTYYPNAFCFEHALRQALMNLLEDYSSPTSPLARELSAMGALEKPSKSELKSARQKLSSTLNRRDSFVSLVRPYKQYQPQNGETVEQNWIFFLRLEGNFYWAIVDRSGEKAPYVYGMN